jgi:hypothetical protein
MASKEALIIAIMNQNADQPMAVTVSEIAKTFEFAESRARAYYSGFVRSGRAPGRVEPKVKAAPKPKRSSADRMRVDAETALAGGRMKGPAVPGMDLKALAHEEVLARLLARKPAVTDEDETLPEPKPIGEPDQDFPLSISEAELQDVLGR